jgi:hypothetical protein
MEPQGERCLVLASMFDCRECRLQPFLGFIFLSLASEKTNYPLYLGCAKISEDFQTGELHIPLSCS